MKTTTNAALAVALLSAALVASPGGAAAQDARTYSTDQLLGPCRTADSDARELGQAAQVECEQYLLGFVDALAATGASGAGKSTCPPAVNTGTEVRWAFVRWVYGDFSKRRTMPAGDAVLATLKDSFPCN